MRPELLGLAAVLLWSTVATAFKLSLRHLDHVQLLLYSSLVAWLVLGFLLVARGQLAQAFACRPGEYLRSFALGVLNPFAYYLILLQAYDRLPAQVAQPLNYTWAITITLLSIPLLGQRIRPGEIVAGFIGYAGVVVISLRGDFHSPRFSDPVGVGLALASTVVWALYWIYNARERRDPVLALFLNFSFALPLIAGWCLIFSSLRTTSWRGLAGAAYIGIFEMGITYVLWLSALRGATNTARVANLIFLAPFLSLVFINRFLGETIRPATLLGLVLIVIALVVQQKSRSADASRAKAR